jgi:competence ComEA-like helix-hairpin-helix protein
MNINRIVSLPPAWLFAAAALVLATTIGVRATSSTRDFSQSPQTPATKQATEAQAEEAFAILGEETIEKTCVTCHPWEHITTRRRTLREWGDVVINMTQRGAQGTDRQFAIVTKFLTRYYGVVDVNTAPAEEISAVLGLSARDAAAIVEHRKTHGKFADAAALGKVQGIDKAKLEEQPEALRFN